MPRPSSAGSGSETRAPLTNAISGGHIVNVESCVWLYVQIYINCNCPAARSTVAAGTKHYFAPLERHVAYIIFIVFELLSPLSLHIPCLGSGGTRQRRILCRGSEHLPSVFKGITAAWHSQLGNEFWLKNYAPCAFQQCLKRKCIHT